MKKENIILLGAEKAIENRLATLDKLGKYRVSEIWDNNVKRKVVYKEDEWEVVKPHRIENFVPILIIPSGHEKEIRAQLLQLDIPEKYIKSWWYCYHRVKDDILEKYSKDSNYQIQKIISYLREKELHVFNNGLFEKYQYGAKKIEVSFDEDVGLYYTYWQTHKMYFKRDIDADAAKKYVNSLQMEQDKCSPHCYEQTCEIGRQQTDVIVDAGAAEGFFSLERVESARHIYIVECDEGWIEALEHTFAPYASKVTIIKKYLSNKNDDCNITLDYLDSMGTPVSVIKMDIEGEEENALAGGEKLFSQNRKFAIVACSHHKTDAYKSIAEALLKKQFSLSVTDGYMFFPYGDSISAELRHGLICANKEKLYNVYVWGIGKFYKPLLSSLRHNCRIVGLLDSNTEPDNEEIMSPQILKNESYDYVLVTVVHFESIVNSYKKLGLPPDKLICLWNVEEGAYDFIDYDVLKCVKQQFYLEKYKLRLQNAPYEYSGGNGPQVIDATVLLDEIYRKKKSLARFGDGEFEMIRMKERPWFQNVDKELAVRLREVINSDVGSLCMAIADNFGNLDKYTEAAADGIREYVAKNNTREEIMKLLSMDRKYYDAYVTRPFLMYRDKERAKRIFALWKKIWENRDVLLVEGTSSRMGVNNDLLNGVRSLHRILCPDCNAFKKYKEILAQTIEHAKKTDLILIKLGPTATVMAYDLAVRGYQAIDIGQLDNEYDWYEMGAVTQERIEGKLVAEAKGCKKATILKNDKYEREIILSLT